MHDLQTIRAMNKPEAVAEHRARLAAQRHRPDALIFVDHDEPEEKVTFWRAIALLGWIAAFIALAVAVQISNI